MEQRDLRGQVALITGGSTEVARAVAVALAQAGVQICLVGKQMDLLMLAAEKIGAGGGACLPIATELDSLEEAEAVLERARAEFGRLDVLILASPFWAGGPIHTHNVKAWDLVLAANLREAFLMARAALPHFRAQKYGEIMAISSDSALGVYPSDGAYSVALHALAALMDLIRVENAELGIRTHNLHPGVALTQAVDSEGKPALTVTHVAEWAVWLLTRPAHLRGNGPILI